MCLRIRARYSMPTLHNIDNEVTKMWVVAGLLLVHHNSDDNGTTRGDLSR